VYRHPDKSLTAFLADDVTAYRLVHSDPPAPQDFLSDREARRRPGREAMILYFGVSMASNPERLQDLRKDFDRLGDWIAQLHLEAGSGFWYAPTHNEHHVTVWGLPKALTRAVVAVWPWQG
jgi:hypothetical protein